MDIFKDKVAVITSAANGIGKALSLQCAKAGMKVILADSDQDNLDRCKIVILHLIKTNVMEQIKNCSPAEKEKLNGLYETAMLPEELANIVFEGITSKKFYIFSHFETHAPKIRQPMENILNGHF